MDMSKAIGETWTTLKGEKKSLSLFKSEELEKAELIVKALNGMTISSAKELLNKVSIAIDQLTKV
ncbi:hypothetical protein [Clostridium beijerinckii]|uniref:Uncharacterized protein n=1 Tax=Clostridium beijerinckii TaxID=1520 RepID=A0AAE5H205_CLOBE|nr:hypothetical protein [Clostridium beijerinckii]ALB44596.1 hypothetical protein X276_04510 [Clostridium beijerinckii NRRL B-598]NSB13033.1 hypothetical protein [Clostridium beijerinckii]OOM22135.1 hypothetical protein CLOBE_44740 [Clostridium beijerinckii]